MFDLIKTYRGKQEIIMTDSRKNVMARMKKLKDSQMKMKVQYLIVPTDTSEKYKKKPENHKRGGGDAVTPRLTKWN